MQALATAADEPEFSSSTPHLSTDYLNRYGEALMLLEMAPMDPEIVTDLQAWRAVGYRAHFEQSNLRCTPSALAAYDGLSDGSRQAFENLCLAMNRLIATVTAVLVDRQAAPAENQDVSTLVDVASEALRALIARATQFINANGLVDITALESKSLQDDIDALFAS
jgi:hypothetical protein